MTIAFNADGALYVDSQKTVDLTDEALKMLNAAYSEKVFESDVKMDSTNKNVKQKSKASKSTA